MVATFFSKTPPPPGFIEDHIDAEKAYLNNLDLLEIEDEEFASRITELLGVRDLFGESHPAFSIRMLVPELSNALYEYHTFSVFVVSNHPLLVTGASKSICSIDCLNKIGRNRIATFHFSNNFKPFLFAGKCARDMKIVYLIANLHEYSEKAHFPPI